MLRDSEGSSSTSIGAIQGEEDASYLSMTNGRVSCIPSEATAFTYS
jgi:hypothetical protein